MSDVFFRDLDLPTPDIFLGVGSGSHALMTGKVMELLEPHIIARKGLIRGVRYPRLAQDMAEFCARTLFLTSERERNWRRKLAEIMITLQLEQRLTKQQILELYINQYDLGRRAHTRR